MKFNNLLLTIYLIFCCFTCIEELQAQVGIGTNTPLASAVLDLNSTNKGFLPPRMTYAQMTSIATPTTGLVVYCTNCVPHPGPYHFNGTDFIHFSNGSLSTVLSSLDCSSAVNSGSLLQLVPAVNVQTSVPYVSSVSGKHNGITVSSTGVSGLTATAFPATFSSSGMITFYITGTPSSSGTATFDINLAEQACTLERYVQ